MSGDKIADIVKDGKDLSDSIIQTVFYKVSQIYAIYSTDERVLVQFADDPKLGSEQRQALSPLNPIRGEINGLIDGWRAGGRINASKKKSLARRFDRRTADALAVALQGDQQHAADLLQSVKDDIVKERTSMGRTEYLITASLCAVIVFVFFSWLSTPATLPTTGQTFGNFVARNQIWLASGVGALGALFSIALGIRGRDIKTDLQRRDNIVDAILRILIGAVSAIILFSLLKTHLVALSLGTTSIDPAQAGGAAAANGGSAVTTHMAIVIAFVAGFSERLVGDVLTSAVLAGVGSKGAAAAADAAGKPKDGANEKNPRGKPKPDAAAAAAGAAGGDKVAEAQDDDDDADGDADATHVHRGDGGDTCLCGVTLGSLEMTDDTELPEASGGIAKAA